MCVVLRALCESFIAIVSLSALPFAGNAVLLNSMMVTNDFDVMARIGLVFPKWPHQKERIMMIDLTFDSEGSAARDASRRAWLAPLARIMMASLAAILGLLLPMLGTGVGSELCHLLSRAIERQVVALFTVARLYSNRVVAALAGGRAFE